MDLSIDALMFADDLSTLHYHTGQRAAFSNVSSYSIFVSYGGILLLAINYLLYAWAMNRDHVNKCDMSRLEYGIVDFLISIHYEYYI